MDPGDSAQGVAAVEVAHERAARPAPSFYQGAFAGLALAAVLAQVWIAWQLAPLRNAYKEIWAQSPPFVLAQAWLYGAPAVGALVVGALVVLRPRSIIVYVVAAAVLSIVSLATWHFAYAPLWSLSGNISG